MSSVSDDLKKRLQKRADEAIEKLLKQKGERRDLSMREMENLVGEFEKDLCQRLVQELVVDTQESPPGLCPTCNGKLRYKGRKSKQVVTLRGEVGIDRDYYQCETCGTGYFPPG